MSLEEIRIPVSFDLTRIEAQLEEAKRGLHDLSKPIDAPEWMSAAKRAPAAQRESRSSGAAPTTQTGKTTTPTIDPLVQTTQRQHAQNVKDDTTINQIRLRSLRDEQNAQAEQRRGSARRTSEGPTRDGTSRYTVTDAAIRMQSMLGQTAGIAGQAGGVTGPVSSVLSLLVRSGPFGALLGGVVGAGAAVSGKEASVQTSRQGLSAAIPSGNMQNTLAALNNAASDYFEGAGTAVKIAESLGTGGVQGGDILGQTRNIMAEQKVNPIADKAALQQLVMQMGVQGGAGPAETGKTLDLLNKAFSTGNISINQMTQSLLDFTQATGGMALGFSGTKQMMAIQKTLGPNVSAGQVIAPAATASGANLAVLANVAGESTQKVIAQQQGKQGGMDTFIDKLGKNMYQMAGGDSTKFMMLNASLGSPFALADLSVKAREQTIQKLGAGTSKTTEKEMTQKVGAVSMTDLRTQGGQAASDMASGWQKFTTAFNSALNNLFNPMQSFDKKTSKKPWPEPVPTPTEAPAPTGTPTATPTPIKTPTAKATPTPPKPEPAPLPPAQHPGTSGGGPLSYIENIVTDLLGGGTAQAAGLTSPGYTPGAGNPMASGGVGLPSKGGGGSVGTTDKATGDNIAQVRKDSDIEAQWFLQHATLTTQQVTQALLNAPWTGKGKKSGSGGSGGSAGYVPGSGNPMGPGGIGVSQEPPGTGNPPGGAKSVPESATVNGTPVPAAVLKADVAASGGNKDLLKLLLQDQMQESGFRPDVLSGETKSSAGAIGLAQFMPSAVKAVEDTKGSPYYGKTFDPTNVAEAAKAQVWFLEKIKGLNPTDKSTWGGALNNYYGSSTPYGPNNQSYANQVQNITVTIVDQTSGGVRATIDPNRKPAGSESSQMRGHYRGSRKGY